MTSSVPYRPKSLEGVSLSLESEFVVLVGASSSGKSTMLQLIQKSLQPTSGKVVTSLARPVYLDRIPPQRYNDRDTIGNLLLPPKRQQPQQLDTTTNDSNALLLQHYSRVLKVNLDQTPAQLSPSELFRFGLLQASLESIVVQEEEEDEEGDYTVHSPILLLDEWMDKEASVVVHKVQESMLQLTREGGVIVYVTHHPHLLENQPEQYRTVALSGGQIISLT